MRWPGFHTAKSIAIILDSERQPVINREPAFVSTSRLYRVDEMLNGKQCSVDNSADVGSLPRLIRVFSMILLILVELLELGQGALGHSRTLWQLDS